jgi:hypothetical protein
MFWPPVGWAYSHYILAAGGIGVLALYYTSVTEARD